MARSNFLLFCSQCTFKELPLKRLAIEDNTIGLYTFLVLHMSTLFEHLILPAQSLVFARVFGAKNSIISLRNHVPKDKVCKFITG